MSPPLGLLPETPAALALACVLDAAVALGVLARAELAPLAGRTVAIEVCDLGVRLRIGYDGRRFYSSRAWPDVVVRADLAALGSLLARTADPDTLFFERRLTVTGDTELGLVVKNALDAVDWRAAGCKTARGLCASLGVGGWLTSRGSRRPAS